MSHVPVPGSAADVPCVHGVYGYCAMCHMGVWPSQPVTTPVGAPLPMGCICPPGANKECENPMCPRKGYTAR